MNLFTIPFILLIVSTSLVVFLAFYILSKKPLIQLQKSFMGILICVLIISLGVLMQNICYNLFEFPPIYFEYFIYIGTCFLPVAIFFMALILKDTHISFRKRYIALFVLPLLSLLVLWTNNIHHLFYINYSLIMSNTTFGPYFVIHSIYTYSLLFISIFMLLKTSIKSSGIFSKQSILFIIGTCIPIIINLLGTTKIISMNVYLTPISFSLAIFVYGLAILKFNFLGAAPIALQKIVDRISDSYIVLNEDGYVTDLNKTFLTTFGIKNSEIIGKNLETFFKNKKIHYEKIKTAVIKAKNTDKTISFQYRINKIHKTFSIEVNKISSDGILLGTLILFKDISQHIEDMKKLKDAQETLMESERLSSLGQLIGGIAHNLKTPIMSISGAAEGLTDLVKEYDSSIDDPEVNSQDHHDIARDMNEWIEKIKEYTSYMSDIITAVKGQAVTLSEADNISFDIDELVKRVDILMKHELKNALIYLNIQMKAPKDTTINGDINSLVQVINNMISNAIQAYNGKTEQNIDLTLEKHKNNLIISVRDYASGIPQKVKAKLFKEMITTKGKNGTGLGLYMSYSTIKAHFNGDIIFESEEGKGTTFNIILPL